MSMRIKIALTIMSIVLVITAAGFVTNLFFVRHSIAGIIGQDISLVIYSSMTFLTIGLLVSVFASPLIIKPFIKIEEQNRVLETLNKAVQKQADEILESHKRTNLLLNAMPICCHLWKTNFEIFYCNEENLRLFKPKSIQEFIDTFSEFSPKYQPDGQLSLDKRNMYLKKTLEEGKCVFEWMHQLKDGTLIPTEVTLVRVIFEDENVIAAYVRDLREQKKMINEIEQRDKLLDAINAELKSALNEAHEANNAKSDFLAKMSHEMRTPLNVIIALSELSMDTGSASGEILSNLEKIYVAGETLLSTVNDILDISKIEAGMLELIPSEYDTPSLINDTITQNILLIGEKPIKFILEIDASMPTYLHGDELRIKQIFNNLLSNAFKYTKKGKVTLRVNCEREGDAVWMTIRVEDSGIGIRSEDTRNLFTDYSQMDIKTNHKIEGTGLGLSITKKISEMMGGFVTMESEYGKGSVFTAKIKQKFVNDSTIGEEVVNNLKNFQYSNHRRRKNSTLVRKQMPYAKVLVVDDMITNLDVTKGMLKPYGIQVDCVTGGQEAIDVIRNEKTIYDAIFMDHMMPEMDGIEAVRIIREEIGTEYAGTVPIIALTANAIIGNEEMFLKNGFQAFISKPINVKQLDAILNTWIASKLKLKEESTESDEKSAKSTQKNNSNILKYAFVKGVDINEGIERYNDETLYLDILRSYCLHTPAILEKIRTLSIDTSAPTKASEKTASISLAEYTILIHGLKGSSSNICADTVSAEAEKLESAGREGDVALIMAKNDSLIAMVEALLYDLGKLLEKADAGSEANLSRDKACDALSLTITI